MAARLAFQRRGKLAASDERLQMDVGAYIRPDGPLDWPHQLLDFQRIGVHVLASRDRVLLADDMGLGKTVQAIAATRILLHRHTIEHALVVVPAGLIAQWQRAFRDWAPELRISAVHGAATDRAWQWRAPAHVFLTSYETIRSDLTDNPHSPPRRRTWDVVVLDEVQKIKNRTSGVARACKRLPRNRAWALTGTPLENCADDLASICEAVAPWREGEPPLRLLPGEALLDRHRAMQLRRRKSDVLSELPEKTVIDVPIELAGAQRRSYERAEHEGIMRLRDLGRAIRITHVLALLTRLKQICNFCPETNESAKIEELRDRLATLTAEGHKALVFSQYADARFGARRIAAEIAASEPLIYTGSLDPLGRKNVLDRFRHGDRHAALVLSLKAGGQGLNLQEASYVFHFDRWWNPSWERQAEDRVHRLGQRLPVTVYRYVCQGTIEKRIEEILASKRHLFDTVVDGVSLDPSRILTRAEIFGLVGIKPPV